MATTHQSDPRQDSAVLAVYAEVCRSYHAIDEFRMKLLGLLPLASIVGLVVLDKGSFGSIGSAVQNEVIAYAGIFASAFTLALFLYEVRGIRRSDQLVERGLELERRMGIHGQFWVCATEAKAAKTNDTKAAKTRSPRHRINRLVNSITAACFIYSLVFSAWLFVALRYGFGIVTKTCVLFAHGFGLFVGTVAYSVVRRLIPA